jgi:RHS repeat-associated protein
MVFSAWVKAPAMHDIINIQLKYKANGTWEYPGGMGQAFYTGGGEWQRLEARLDLSQIAGLESVQAITRNHGSNSIAAYWDDLQLMTVEPAASSYDVQVATDADFSDLIKSQAGQSAQSLEVGALAKGTTYHWRVRAQNATGPGAWSTRSFQTIDRAPRRYYVKDHLGSIRAVVNPDAAGSETDKVVETRDYHPFGLRMPGRTVTPGMETAEDFTGYEKDSESGFLYAGARYYMAALGRFSVTDRFADKEPTLTPYQYAANNPTITVDINGDSTYVENKEKHEGGFWAKVKNFFGSRKNVEYVKRSDGFYNTETNQKANPENGSFLSQVISGRKQLAGTAAGQKLVSTFDNSATDHILIVEGSNGSRYNSPPPGGKALVEWDSDNTTATPNAAGAQRQPSWLALGHEIAHACDDYGYDGQQGINGGDWLDINGNPYQQATVAMFQKQSSTHHGSRI